ncbi:hypothetical protein MHU86_11548 [Fragilaria crotonensis]|nr:hypothetical protein MHU86_11548 [Fragilaria crotonensis]
MVSEGDTPSVPNESLPVGQGLQNLVDNPNSTPICLLESAKLQWRQLFSRSSQGNVSRANVLSTSNMRSNAPWGDVLGPKASGITRLYSINVNGISIDRRGGTFADICRSIKEVQADIFCGQEHNLDTTQFRIRSALFESAKQHWKKHRISFGTTPITVEKPYKPGGTMILTVDSLMGRVVRQTRDSWGRWVVQEFKGKGTRQIAVFSVYQPVDKTVKPGTITVAAQQASLLRLAQDSVLNPRTAFRRDLLRALQEYLSAGTLLLVVGDFNESFGADPDGMSKIAGQLGLLDIIASRHSSKPPATYARGTKRLDYALASPLVGEALISAGYEEFNAHIVSDHRGFFLDFDTNLLFGSETQQLVSAEARDLSSSNIRQVTAYIREKHRILFHHHNALARSGQLSLPGNRHAFAERLDQDVLAASLAAAAKVKQFDEPAWSVELAEARKLVVILKKQRSALRTLYDHSSLLASEMAKLSSPVTLPSTVPECNTAIRKVEVTIREIIAESYERRDQERQRKIATLEMSGKKADKESATRLRHMKKAEDIKQLFRKISGVRNNKVRRGVTRIEIPLHPAHDPKTCTEWRQVEVPTEIVRLLQERNRKHFGQAKGTPFTVPPLLDDLGFRGDRPLSQRILEGTYEHQPGEVDQVSENVRLLLQHFEQVQEMAEAPSFPTISMDEFTSKLRVWSESTTTSPSGMHLGHYKALIARHSYSSDLPDEELTQEFRDNRDELNRMQDDLRNLHLTLLNYALERGYSYRRWQTIANTILFKDQDNVRLHRTRVIHIYEADFNLALGIKWRIHMYQAEALAALNDGQYGSRPRRNATDPVFIEELQCEISRATRRSVALINYDALACFDRIIPNEAMIVSRKFGVPLSVTQANALTLEKAEFRVRTELGLAPSGYSHSLDMPIYGTGQGSANSPAIWCFLSSCLMDAYDTKATPAVYYAPDESTSVSLGLVAFVDDCNGQANNFLASGSDETLRDILTRTQQNAQLWNDLLHSSGGALELSKCSCQVLHWWFTNQGAPFLAPKQSTHQEVLRVIDRATETTHQLPLLSPYEAHKTLGHYKSPAGTQSEQFRRLKSKSDEITAFLWTCPLTRLETWTFYYACYLPSVGYPLACSSLTKNRLDKVQRKAMSIIVPRCGFNRHTKTEILYGPLALGGANFRHLYVEQGIGQVGLFIRNWRLKSTAGKLLRIAVGWFQHQIGTSYSFLEKVDTPLPHLESKWLASLREFLHAIKSCLQLDNPGIPTTQRHHDTHIMDAILESQLFSASEIRRLNYCRLYLHAQTISDLTDVSGYYLDRAKYEGRFSHTSSTTHGMWIHQHRPSLPEWKLWQRANLLWSDEAGKLHQALGPWLQPINKHRQSHAAYQLGNRLWIRDRQYYRICELSGTAGGKTRAQFRRTRAQCKWQHIPTLAVPVEVDDVAEYNWEVTARSTVMAPPRMVQIATFEQYIADLDSWEYDLLSRTTLSTDPFSIGLALSYGVRGVSDGSVWLKQMGAFGWTLSTDMGERTAEGMGPAPGATPNSYRSEAYGMLAMLCFLKRLAEFTYQHEPWQGTLATDSLSLVDTVLGIKRRRTLVEEVMSEQDEPVQLPLDPLSPEWDLIVNIRRLFSEMPGLTLEHVRGHQDQRTNYQRLSLMAQLNVDADAMATTFQREFGAIRPYALLTEDAGVHLITPNGTVTTNYKAAIRHQATYGPLLAHLQARNGWSSSTTERINWKAHATCLHKRMTRRDHFIKLVQGILPTNHAQHRSDPRRRGCPTCTTCRDEDWEHILRCDHPRRAAWRRTLLGALAKLCDKWGTRPGLRNILLDGIRGVVRQYRTGVVSVGNGNL